MSRVTLTERIDARLVEKCTTPGGAEITVWKWLRAMKERSGSPA